MTKIKDFLKKTVTRKSLLHLFYIVAGSFLLAFGTGVFLVPYQIVCGGLSGIAILTEELFGWNVETIVTILTWFFFIIGALFLGKKFAMQTLCSSIVYPVALAFCMFLQKNVDFLVLPADSEISQLMAAIFGGAFIGVGCALTFLGGGSTGGTDIPAFLMQKYLHIKCSIGTFLIDASIIIIGLFVFKDLTLAMIGILSAFVTSLLIDKIFLGNSRLYVANIISSKWEEINSYIITKMERGTTLFDSVGGFSKKDQKMIQVAFDAKEFVELKDMIYKIDPKAFLTIVKAHEITGEGFKPFKEPDDNVFKYNIKKRNRKKLTKSVDDVKKGEKDDHE